MSAWTVSGAIFFQLLFFNAFMPGFLGTRGSLMLDVVFLAMFLIIPFLGVSIYLVRYRRKYQLHKWIQIVMGLALLVVVVMFEVDMRLFTDWEALAVGSPYYVAGTWDAVWISLAVHLVFAIVTPLVWGYVIVAAMLRYSSPPLPNQHSRTHIFWARIAAILMTLTAVTGCLFYYIAFAAT